jgi:hypothetical protein
MPERTSTICRSAAEKRRCFRNNFYPGNQRRLAAKKIAEAGNQELTGDRNSPFI